MGLDEVFDDGEAEAGAALLAGSGFVHPVEALEDAFEGIRRDAGAVIGNGDLDLAGIGGARADGDGAAGTAVFDGVVDEAGEDLFQVVGIGEDWTFRGLVDEGDVLKGSTLQNGGEIVTIA